MIRYKNLSGDSGVCAFEIGEDNIKIQFNNSSVYIYNNIHTGSRNIAQMKTLAEMGRGLGTFINKYVRDRYARKIK
jgi:hypothetical protein